MSADTFDLHPIIIFLNGTSSSGKTSIARVLQEKFTTPFLHIGIDTFLFTLPPAFRFEGKQAALGYEFTRADDEEGPKVVVRSGYYGQKLDAIKRDTMQKLLENGFNLIVDEVLFSNDEFIEYVQLFAAHKAYFVSIKPPLEVCEYREKKRGDRLIGLARGVYEQVYNNKTFDLEIDSSKITPNMAAEIIQDYIAHNPNPTAFKNNQLQCSAHS